MPICENCRIGAQYKAQGMSAGMVKSRHDRCQQPATCPCQHREDAVYIRDEEEE